MDKPNPKTDKKSSLREVAKQLSNLRKKPLSNKVHEIVRENYERTRKDKKIAKSDSDAGL